MKRKIIITDLEEKEIRETKDLEWVKKLILSKCEGMKEYEVFKAQKILLREKEKSVTLSKHEEFAEDRRKKLLKNETKSEKRIAYLLDKLKLKYSKQHTFHTKYSFYIADFYLPELKMILEVDGGYHSTDEQRVKDKERDLYFLRQGIMTKRLINEKADKMTALKLQAFLYSKGIY